MEDVSTRVLGQPTQAQLAIRRANRERKRKQRAREKIRSDRAIQAYIDRLHAEKVNAEGLARRIKLNQCMPGETAPGVDAQTVEEALEVAREMARALGAADVMEGESLYDFERRIFNEWANYSGFIGRPDAGGTSPDAGGGGAPLLNRETGELSPGFGRAYWIDHCGGFDKCWSTMPGAKEKINIASLPRLKAITKPEEPKPEPKPVPPTPRPVIPQPQPTAATFSWVPPHAYQYLIGNGGA